MGINTKMGMSIVRKHIKWAYDGIELERMVYSYPHTG